MPIRTQEERNVPDHSRRGLRLSILPAAFAAVLMAAATGSAFDLITEAEARLPPPQRTTPRGGITRGPSIVIVAPGTAADVKAPFAIRVNFQPHGGSKIDVSTVKVIYLKRPNVDLTPRLKGAISETGIDVTDANAPPGIHDIRIDVTDAEGRTRSA